MSGDSPPVDVAIVGAGLCGLGLAEILHRQGRSVVLAEHRAEYPDTVRAEKIEPGQAKIFRRLGLLDLRLPCAPPIGTILNCRGASRSEFDTVEQYGFRYHTTINALRERLAARVELRAGRVVSVRNSCDLQRLEFADGQWREARLVVIATGGTSKLPEALGMQRLVNPSLRTMTFGYDVDPSGIEWPGMNVYAQDLDQGVDYVTWFRIGDAMRVNVFTQWAVADARVKQMRADPRAVLREVLPGALEWAGDPPLVSDVKAFPTVFHRLRKVDQAGCVVIGDEYQSVSPASGTGLDKVAADLDLLGGRYIPQWLASAGMGVDKIAAFYRDPVKLQADSGSLNSWLWYRDHFKGRLQRRRSRLMDRFRLRPVASARPRSSS